jgi:alpha-ketoglutarate-dependent 2,4-dichlorophenoxyacetate dioxygenase
MSPAPRRQRHKFIAISIYPITEKLAAEVGVDLAHLSAEDVASIKDAFWRYGVLIFPDQKLDQDQHLAFAEHLGPLESTISGYANLRLRADLVDVSNLNPNNEIWSEDSKTRGFGISNRLWHTDSSFKYLPARASLLYAYSIAPIGGHTEFADLRAAYDALPQDMRRRLEGLVAEHALAYSRARTGFTNFSESERKELPPVPQVMVRTIPENGRRTLYLASHIGRIFGMSDDQCRTLLDGLIAHATQRQFVYTHRWRLHDLVMWDDRCTMHRGTEYDDLRYRRDMQRATVSDIANTCEQEGVAIPQS